MWLRAAPALLQDFGASDRQLLKAGADFAVRRDFHKLCRQPITNGVTGCLSGGV
jgi:hypothetical protein